MQSLVIAPVLSGTFFCEEAIVQAVADEDTAARVCAHLCSTAASRIEAALSAIGPKVSPSGEYQLGYTLIVPLFRYFQKVDGAWTLDVETLRANMQTISEVDRPVVVHLSGTHFTFSGVEFSRELAQDERNLQWTRSGPAVPSDYFNVPIVAWTLADTNAPVNVARREAMNAAIDALCDLPASARERIVAVSVLGETHDIFPSLVDGPTYGLRPEQLTDYSPIMADRFRDWLNERYGTIDSINQHLCASFPSFESIQPPSRDLRTEAVDSFFEHFDDYAAGKVDIYGWVHDQRGRPLTVKVLLDGQEAGTAEMGFSRTDVTEALSLTEANVGFRYGLDFRQLPFGHHTVEVLVSAEGEMPLFLAKCELVHIDRHMSPWEHVSVAVSGAAPMSSDTSLRGSLDGPGGGQVSIFYNPLADLWLQFRNLVVRQYIEEFASIAGKSCIPTSKVFTHQISPVLYGGWNSDILAVESSLMPSERYTPGTTLYGGAASGDAFLAMKQRVGWSTYGVTEMHPVTPMADGDYAAMFDLHRRAGAAFVAPYYMEVPTGHPRGGDLERFRIAPDNPRYGSDLFYHSIKVAMTR